MQCGVPVLTSENTSMQEAGGEAALYFNPENNLDIADKMMTIYKDEKLRTQLFEAGFIIANKFRWQHSAEQFWEIILKTIE